MSISKSELVKLLQTNFSKSDILSEEVDLITYARDASFYTLKPLVVVRPKNIQQIQFLFSICNQYRIPLTFRTAGTSLSGQAITNGILADVGYYWKEYQIVNDGKSIILEPGIIGSHANSFLKPYKRKIGPDPASINSCMIGGILANNASGMCCGVKDNSYHTLEKIQAVLPNGYILDTYQENYQIDFQLKQKTIYEEILNIREYITKNKHLVSIIQEKYKIKNTTGYSLNAFVDFSHPADILAHLMIGSEGTLGFIAKAQLKTISDKHYKYTGLLCYSSIFDATESIPLLIELNASSVELMDQNSIRSIRNKKNSFSYFNDLSDTATVLLVEFEGDSEEEIQEIKKQFQSHISKLKTILPPFFTENAEEREAIWKIRKGLFPTVSGLRESRTTVIIEDIAFPLKKLPYAVLDLQKLFVKHHYNDAIIFGHAKDGNLHFVITPSFHTEEGISQYDAFIKDVVEMVVHKYNGSLKAEHGTGRNMAPFVELEWGKELYLVMKKIKQLLDPNSILNPDVIISNDQNIHIQNLKKIPEIESIANMCMECGFCESVCPSKLITTTPRKRILLRRELEVNPITSLPKFQYYFEDTCVRCGLCELSCPLNINTGELVKLKKSQDIQNTTKETFSLLFVKYFHLVEKFIRFSVLLVNQLGTIFFPKHLLRIINSKFRFPYLLPNLLNTSNFYQFLKTYTTPKTVDFYYFPTCLGRVFSSDGVDLVKIIDTLSKELGIKIHIIDSTGYCCSQPFESKGFYQAKSKMINKTVDLLNKLNPSIPIIVDNSSCTYSFKKNIEYKQFKFLDSIEFLDLLIRQYSDQFKKIYKKIYIQNICSVEKLHLRNMFFQIAKKISEEVITHPFSECCGFAGDRGLLYPEVNQSTIGILKQRIEKHPEKENIEGFFSSNLTCEVGLSQSGYKFRHILFAFYESLKKNGKHNMNFTKDL